MITLTAKAVAAADGKSFTVSWSPSSTERLAEFLLHYRKKGATAWTTVRCAATVRSEVITVAPAEYEWQLRVVETGSLASGVVTVAAPAVAEAPGLALTADKSGVVVESLPQGATAANFAQMKDASGANPVYLPKGVALGATVVPQAGTPVVDAIGVTAGGAEVGKWYSALAGHSRIATTPKVEPTPTPTPGPTPKPGSVLIAGLNGGNWGANALPDVAGMGVRAIRLAKGMLGEAAAYKAKGFKVVGIIAESGSIGAHATQAFGDEVARLCAEHDLDGVEPFNEPDGSWFWSDPNNYSGYVRAMEYAYTAVRAKGLRTAVLTNWGTSNWGNETKKLGVLNYADGVVVHPYGGASGNTGGAAGNRPAVQRAWEQSGLPVWVTEIGWPTGQGSTGDSQAWSFSQQAANIGAFVTWAAQQGTSRVAAVFIYQYKNSSDSGPVQYGVEMHDSWTHKPSAAVLGEACRKLAAGEPLGSLGLEAVAQIAVDMSVYSETAMPSWEPGEKLTPFEAACG